MSTYIKRKIVRRKGSRNRILLLLDCGHVRSFPTCISRTWKAGKLLRCLDCEQLEPR